MQRHRITTSTAAVVDQPTPFEIDALVSEVDRSGHGGFLVAERRGHDRTVSTLQALRERVGWTVQATDGVSRSRCESRIADVAGVRAVLLAWTTERSLAGCRPGADRWVGRADSSCSVAVPATA